MATKKSKNPLTAMTAGCIAGAVEATCVWPMEFIKVRRSSNTYMPKHRVMWKFCFVCDRDTPVWETLLPDFFLTYLFYVVSVIASITKQLPLLITMTSSKKKDTITIAITYQRCTITIYWYGIRVNLYSTKYRIF